MAIYVDDAKNGYGRMVMSHMVADTEGELHKMAGTIGLRREWFQDGRYPHYDLCQSKKREAIELGAIEITRRELVMKFRI